jgi:uncharacterized protein (UPF0548 family)
MFLLRQPDEGRLQEIREAHRGVTFSYADSGRTRDLLQHAESDAARAGSGVPAPKGYRLDHHVAQLGIGAEVFAQARQALQTWQMLQLGDWLRPCWPRAPIVPGEIVGTLAQVLGIWSVNVCRIVYVIDESERSCGRLAPRDKPMAKHAERDGYGRFGFAYGTLPGHPERGEECFLIERRADDNVWYHILAYSRPGRLVAWLGYPYVRQLQKRFALESIAAMQRAVVRAAKPVTPPAAI